MSLDTSAELGMLVDKIRTDVITAARMVSSLIANSDALAAERDSFRGAIRAQDERERMAGEACGVSREMHGCDWPDAVAEVVIALRQRAEAAEARVRDLEQAWQPIATAPDGCLVLCADMHAKEARYWAVVGWRHQGNAPSCVTTPERVQYPVTHWMPLPSPPSSMEAT